MEATTPFWVYIFLSLYFCISICLFLYGMHAYLMAWLYRGSQDKTSPRPRKWTPRPVTIQLPLFNERYVAKRLIDAVAVMRYPSGSLEIQVLDDSNDGSENYVAELVAEWRDKGKRIVHIHRKHRTGFKGGALREGLATATGELIAIFDADFIPPRDFLMETVPYFEAPDLGMVQARWAHLNEDYSALTRAQAVALDGHFIIEQTVRNRNGAFINFNGTAGIWRKQSILDAGNWQDDTLTEDLDLSYRAQLAGWRFLFLPDLECPAELPAEANGLKGQQFRWAKGSVQTAKKLLPLILKTPAPRFTRFQAAVHLTNHAVYPLLLLLGLAAFPALIILDQFHEIGWMFRAATFLVIASFGHPWLYLTSQRARGKSWLDAAMMVPVVVAGNMGIAINNSRALIQALAGHKSPFERTPKYALVSRGDQWREKVYRVPSTAWPVAELLLAAYAVMAIIYATVNAHYLAVPFLLMYVVGAGYLGFFSIRNAWFKTRNASSTESQGLATVVSQSNR